MRRHVQQSLNTATSVFLLALFLLPLLVNPTISLNFNDVFLTVKVIWTLAVVLPSAVVVIYRCWVPVDRTVLALLGVWFCWMALSVLWNRSGALALTGAPDRLQGLPVYLTYGLVVVASYMVVRRSEQIRSSFVVVLSGLIVPLGLYVALQYYGFVGILSDGASSGVLATVSGATLGHRGYLTGCIALLLPLAATFAARSRWGLLYMVLAGFSLTASLTRGAFLAAMIGYVFWACQGNLKRYAVHAAVLLGLLLPLPHLTASQVDLRSFGDGVGEQKTSDNSGRTPLWNTALYGIQLRPFLGWGLGQLLNVMAQRPDAELLHELGKDRGNRTVQQLPRTSGDSLNWRLSGGGQAPERVTEATNAVHNEYLEYAFTYGLPAAAAFVSLFVIGIWRSWRHVPWAAASLVAYLIYLLTWPETVRFAPLAWAVLGIALASGAARISTSTQE